jgi:hypothetical protein
MIEQRLAFVATLRDAAYGVAGDDSLTQSSFGASLEWTVAR